MTTKYSTDSAIRIKGSLAIRVFLSAIAFLVIPLIFYSAFTYKSEYDRGLDDAFDSLEISLDDQLKYMAEVATLQSHFVDALYALVLSNRHESISNVLSTFVSDGQISSIVYLKLLPNEDLICIASSMKSLVGRNFKGLVNLKSLENTKERVFLGDNLVGEKSIYLLKLIENPLSHEVEGLIAISMGLKLILNELSAFGNLPFTEVSILSLSGEVLASTHIGLSGKTLIFKEEEEGITGKAIPIVSHSSMIKCEPLHNGYEFVNNGEARLAVVKSVSNLPLKVVVDAPKKNFTNEVKVFFIHLVELLAFIILLGGSITYCFTLRMAKPLQQLCYVMGKGEKGDFNVRYKKDRFGFELNQVGRQYNLLMERIREMISEIREERTEKERYATQMVLALEIQKSLLPVAFDFSCIEVATIYMPAIEVAGDLYDCIRISDKKLLFSICDVAGKGLQACLYSLGFRSIVRSVASFEIDLATLSQKVNQLYLKDTINNSMFVTAWIGIYDEETKILEYSSFGHPPVLLRRHDAPIIHLETSGFPFGIQEMQTVETKKEVMLPNDLIVLYTDGVTEAMNREGELFGLERLEFALRNIDVATPEAVTIYLQKRIRDFSTPNLHDDVSILSILIK